VNLSRLNHILIPTTKAERDRFRQSRAGRTIYHLFRVWLALSDEGRYLMLLWLITGAAGLSVRSNHIFVLWSALTGLIAVSVVCRRFFNLEGVSLRVTLPPRTSVGEEVTFSVTVRNESRHPYQAIRMSGPFLPWDGSYTGDQPVVPILPAHASKRVEARARFQARGEHHLDPFTAASLVPFGIAVGPDVSSVGIRFLVVPRVATVVRFETPVTHRYQPGGVALASLTGESMELVGVRPYKPGDPIRDLHARSWARLGYPVVREYRQEYFTRIGVLLDTDFEKENEKNIEASISLAAGLVAHLCKGEALIDVLLIGEEVYQLTLGRSLGFLDQALDLLACVEPGSKLDPSRLETRLGPFLPQLSWVVLVTTKWDEQRRQLALRVSSKGVGCRVLCVKGMEKIRDAPPSPEVTYIDASAIARGEDIAL
jgi:uncharacterized protein (DUF58 family)